MISLYSSHAVGVKRTAASMIDLYRLIKQELNSTVARALC